MPPVTILLVDPSPEFLASAKRFLSTEAQVKVIGCARSGEDALEQAVRLSPDLVLMCIAMPGMDGLEAASLLRSLPNAPRIILLNLYDMAEYRDAAKRAGADGYVTKSDFGTGLLPQMQALFAN